MMAARLSRTGAPTGSGAGSGGRQPADSVVAGRTTSLAVVVDRGEVVVVVLGGCGEDAGVVVGTVVGVIVGSTVTAVGGGASDASRAVTCTTVRWRWQPAAVIAMTIASVT